MFDIGLFTLFVLLYGARWALFTQEAARKHVRAVAVDIWDIDRKVARIANVEARAHGGLSP